MILMIKKNIFLHKTLWFGFIKMRLNIIWQHIFDHYLVDGNEVVEDGTITFYLLDLVTATTQAHKKVDFI